MKKKKLLMTLGVTLFSSTLWLSVNKTNAAADNVDDNNAASQANVQATPDTTTSTTNQTTDLAAGKVAANSALQLNVQTAKNQITDLQLAAEQTSSLQQKLQEISTQFATQIDQAQTSSDLTNIQTTAKAQIQTVVQQANSLQTKTVDNQAEANNTTTTPAPTQDDTNTAQTTTASATDATPTTANDESSSNTDTSTNTGTNEQPDETAATNNEQQVKPAAVAATNTTTKPQISNFDDTVAHVTNQVELAAAAANANVNTIILDNDMTLTGNTDMQIVNRDVTIESAGTNRYYLDMRDMRFTTGNGDNTITFKNIDFYGSNYWGIINPSGKSNTVNSDGSINRGQTIVFDNITYTGKQMIHANGQTVVIRNNVQATSVPSYDAPDGSGTVTSTGYNPQQVIEISGSGAVEFESNATFTGTSYRDQVIQIGAGGNVTLDSGSKVTLNPHSHGQWSEAFYSNIAGIYINGAGTIDAKDGSTLNINVAGEDAKDTAQAINIGNGSKINLESGSTVNINSDGTIYQNLVSVGGSLNLDEGSSFNINGQNMDTFKGSIVNISSNGSINNTGGTFKVAVDGTGAMTLLNISGAKVNIDNPKDFVLDASNNANAKLINNSTLTLNDVKFVHGTETSGPLDKLSLKVNNNTIGTINAPSDASATSDIVGKTSDAEQQVVGWLSDQSLTGKKLEFISAGPFIDVDNVAIDTDKTHVTGHVSSKTAGADLSNTYIYVTVNHGSTQTPMTGTVAADYWRDTTPKYMAKTDAAGNFSFDIPADTLQPGDTLTFSANKDFVDGLTPLNVDPEVAAALQTSRDTADDAIDAAATAAKTAIESNSSLTPEQIAAAKTAVDDAVTAAKNNIASATTTDGITVAQTAGELAISKVKAQAQLDNAQASALKQLSDAGLTGTDLTTAQNAISQAYQTATDHLTNANDQAGVDAVINNDLPKITAAATTAVNDHQLQQAKSDADAAIDAAASAAKTAIESNSSLTSEQITAAKTAVDDAAANAKTNIASATTTDGINTAQTAGELAISKAKAQAQLDNAQASALKQLNDAGLTGTDLDNATAAISQAYQTANTNLTNANDQAGVDDVISTDLPKITAAATSAVNDHQLQQAKDEANAAIDAAANAAQTAIDNDTSLTPAQRNTAKNQITTAANQAKNNVNTATTTSAVNSAQTAGKLAINKLEAQAQLDNAQASALQQLSDAGITEDPELSTAKASISQAYQTATDNLTAATKQRAVNQVISTDLPKITQAATAAVSAHQLQQAKDNADAAIDAAATAAKTAIESNSSLTPEQITAAKNAVDNAATSAKSNIDSATTNDDVTTAQTAGELAINKLQDQAQLDNAKANVEAQLTSAGITGTALTTAQQDLTAAYNEASANLTAAKTQTAADQETSAGVKAINQVLATAQLAAAKTNAQQALANKLQSITTDINGLTNLTSAQKKTYQDQAKAAYDQAFAQISKETDPAQIATEQTTGEEQIAAALTTAQTENTAALTTAQTSAKQALDQEQAAALAKIDQLNWNTPAQKTAAEQQVNQAHDAAVTAVDNATTTAAVTTQQQTGIDQMQQAATDAQNLVNDQANAIAVLQETKTQALAKLDQLNLTPDQKTAATTAVNTAFDQAVANVKAAGNVQSIAQAQADGVTQINNAVADANSTATALQQAKDLAKEQLESAKDTAEKQVNAHANLTDAQKQDYIQQIESAFKEANDNLASQTAISAVQNVANAGIKQINDVVTTAADQNDLQKAQADAQTQLTTAKQKADAQIDGNTKLTAAQKAAAHQQVTSAYKAAQANIDDQTTIADVNTARDDGITAMNAAVIAANTDAENLKQSRLDAIQALAAAQVKADDDIDNSSLTAAQKQAAHQQVAADYTSGVASINAASDITGVTTAQSTWVQQIQQDVVDANNASQALKNKQQAAIAELATAKGQADQAIDASSLSDAQKTAAHQAVATAYQDGVDAINGATSTTEVDHVKTPALDQINAALTNAQQAAADLLDDKSAAKHALMTAQNQAYQAINDSDLTPAQKQSAKAAVDDQYDNAINNVDQAATPTAVQTAQDDGVTAIDQAVTDAKKAAADLATAKTDAIKSLDDEQTKQNTAIDDDTNLNADQKAAAKQAVKQAHDQAVAQVNAANDTAGVTSAQSAGISAIDQAYTDAQTAAADLANAKATALSALDTAQADANNQIDADDNLNADQKAAAKANVQAAYDAGKQAIQTATTTSDITDAKDGATLQIEQAVTDAQGKADALQQAKNQALLVIAQTQADQYNKIDQADWTPAQKQAARAAVKQAYDQGVSGINAVSDVNDVPQTQQAAQTAIINAYTQAQQAVKDLAAAKTSAQQALQTAKDNADNEINNSNLTDAQKQAALAAVDQAFKQSQAEVEDATTTKAVDTAQTDGVTAIAGAVIAANTSASELAADKTAALAELQQTLDQTNSAIAADSNLDDAQKAAATQAAQAAYDDAVSNVQTANSATAVINAKNTGKQAIQAALSDAQTAAQALQTAKNNALQDLDNAQQAADDVIDADPSLDTDAKKQAAKAQVAAAYNQAVTAVTAASDVDGVNTQKTAGVAAINQAQSDAQALQAAKDTALAALADERDTAQQAIIDANLDPDAAAAAQQAITAAYGHAVDQVNNAQDVASVDTQKAAGITAIDQAVTDAQTAAQALQTAKDSALAALQTAKENADSQVASLDASQQAAAKKAIQAAYDQAVGKVKAATTPADVTTQQAAGVAAINQAVTDAQNTAQALQTAKDSALAALQTAKENADSQVASLDASQQSAAKKAIQAAYDQAVGKVKTATTAADVTTQQDAGVVAINQAVTDAQDTSQALQAAKDTALAALADERDTAQQAIIDAHLDPAAATVAQQAILSAYGHAVDKISAANDAAEITTQRDSGIAAIDQAVTDAQNAAQELQSAKDSALAALQTAKENADSQVASLDASQQAAAKQAIQAAYDQAVGKVKATTTPADVTTQQDVGVAAINQAVTAAQDKDLAQAKATALATLQAAKTTAENAINSMNLSATQKQSLRQQVQTAYDTAAANITQANTITAAQQAAQTGVAAIEAVIDQANAGIDLTNAQQNALTALQNAQASALQLIENMTLPTADKTGLEQQVQDQYAQAAANVAQAKTPQLAQQASSTGVTAIAAIVQQATNAQLAQAKTDADAALTSARQQAEQDIHAMALTQEQKTELLNQLEQKFEAAKAQIENATTPDTANAAALAGITEINGVEDAAINQETADKAQASAMAALDQAHEQILQDIAAASISPTDKATLTAKADDIYSAAQQQIITAHDSNNLSAILAAQNNGVARLKALHDELENMPVWQPTVPTIPTISSEPTKPTQPTMERQKGVVTVKPNVTNGYVVLYDQDGNQIDSQVLGANTAWKIDYKRIINGQTYYRVGADEYVKASDVDLTPEQAGNNQIVDGVVTTNKAQVPVYNAQGQVIAERTLGHNTQWLTNNQQTINGQTYYQVAPNEFVSVNDVTWTPQAMILNRKVGALVINQASAPVYHYDPARSLMVKSNSRTVTNQNPWRYDRQLIVNGHTYYRVAADEWVEADKVLLN